MVAAMAAAATRSRGSSRSARIRHPAATLKDVWILRHGQAAHNPRAEEAQSRGCSHAHFLELMRQDDCLDAPLTTLGQTQAADVWHQHGRQYWSASAPQSYPELIVSSPLSRALQTADLALNHHHHSNSNNTIHPNKVCYEGFREINGWLLNAQRRSKGVLQQSFATWNFDHLLSEHDDQWDPDTLEDAAACAERGFAGLRWLATERPEQSFLLVAHGGILKLALTQHPNVILIDGRRRRPSTSSPSSTTTATDRSVQERFHNCELRRYRMEYQPKQPLNTCDDDDDDDTILVLTEIDLDYKWEVTHRCSNDHNQAEEIGGGRTDSNNNTNAAVS